LDPDAGKPKLVAKQRKKGRNSCCNSSLIGHGTSPGARTFIFNGKDIIWRFYKVGFSWKIDFKNLVWDSYSSKPWNLVNWIRIRCFWIRNTCDWVTTFVGNFKKSFSLFADSDLNSELLVLISNCLILFENVLVATYRTYHNKSQTLEASKYNKNT
jgi:hypothetical protein